MPNLVVVGSQWGDEGKGKVVDYLARTAQMVVRYQGGPNAGHTVCVDGRTFIFHQIPCGVLNPRAACVIGCGCVVDPYVLNHELAELRKNKIRPGTRLVLDGRAHLIMPYHRLLDRLHEERNTKGRIGTTGRGIGPAYGDKFVRTGMRAADLIAEETFNEKLKRNVAAANFLLMERYKADPIPFKSVSQQFWQATRSLARLVTDAARLVEAALRRDERVLFEGAQGMHLDIDLGTYPFVTSSSTWAGGVAPGVGISPLWLEQVVGVAKAYTTRVGLGPFPTEMCAAESQVIRDLGREFGATTGRPRRCGWFDAPVVRAAARYNRFAALIITKLDVLDSLEEIKVCHAYRVDGREVAEFDPLCRDNVEPLYLTMPGWRQATSGCVSWRELPVGARRYVAKLEELTGCPVALVSTGKERNHAVPVHPQKLKWLRSN